MSPWRSGRTRRVLAPVNLNTVLLALVMGLSPLAVLASVLLLTMDRGKAKAAAYAVGWVVATTLVGVLTLVVDSQVSMPSGSTSSTASAWLDVVLGVILIVVAFRHRGGQAGVSEPSWMKRLDTMSPLVALGFGLFMPPYMLAAAGANNIVQADQPGGSTNVTLAVIVFTVVASIGVLVPLALAQFSSRSDEVLARWRAWLMANWAKVMVWLFSAIGVYLMAKGVYELVG
jgi:hypothetical protein